MAGDVLQLDILTNIGGTTMRVGEAGTEQMTPGIKRLQRARLTLLPGGEEVRRRRRHLSRAPRFVAASVASRGHRRGVPRGYSEGADASELDRGEVSETSISGARRRTVRDAADAAAAPLSPSSRAGSRCHVDTPRADGPRRLRRRETRRDGAQVMGVVAGCLDDFWASGEDAVLKDVVASFNIKKTGEPLLPG